MNIKSLIKITLLAGYFVFMVIAILKLFEIHDEIQVEIDESDIKDEIVIAGMACDIKLDNMINMIKSVILFNIDNRPLRFVIVAEEDDIEVIEKSLIDFQSMVEFGLEYELYEKWIPDEKSNEWTTLRGACDYQKLFLHKILPHIDSVIYLDSDVILLYPISTLWSIFLNFTESQVFGSALEYRNDFEKPKYPIYGEYGLQTGVSLFNLTKIRNLPKRWTRELRSINIKYNEYSLKDQDILNIYFEQNREKLHTLSCEWNFRPSQCDGKASQCEVSEDGIKALHGTSLREGGNPTDVNDSTFRMFYYLFSRYELEADPYESIVVEFKKTFLNKTTACEKISDDFVKTITEFFKDDDDSVTDN